MIYLVVNHVGDDDADYFCFKNIAAAAKYVMDNFLEDWTMSDVNINVEPEEYTYIEV